MTARHPFPSDIWKDCKFVFAVSLTFDLLAEDQHRQACRDKNVSPIPGKETVAEHIREP